MSNKNKLLFRETPPPPKKTVSFCMPLDSSFRINNVGVFVSFFFMQYCLIKRRWYQIYDAPLEQPSPGTLKAKIFESQIIYKSLLARKSKDPDRIAKIGHGHLCLLDKNLSLNNTW